MPPPEFVKPSKEVEADLRKLRRAIMFARRGLQYMVAGAEIAGDRLPPGTLRTLRDLQSRVSLADRTLSRGINLVNRLGSIAQVARAAEALNNLHDFTNDDRGQQAAAVQFGLLVQGLGEMMTLLPPPLDQFAKFVGAPAMATFFTNVRQAWAPSTDRAARMSRGEGAEVSRALSRPR